MTFTFSPVLPHDKDKMLKMFKKAAERIAGMNIDHWQYWKNPPAEKLKWVNEGIEKEEFFFIQNTLLQTIGLVRILKEDLLYWGKKNDKALYIHSLVVSEKYTGKGIGKKILQTIEADARQTGYQYLRLDSDAKNPKLCHYYEKQGFEKVGIKSLPLSTYNLYQKNLKR